MGELIKIVDSLENKISKLLHKLEVVNKANMELEDELTHIKSSQVTTSKTVSEWEEKYNSLKLANSMLGSNTNKTEAKLKINTLIRELDHCITQLSEYCQDNMSEKLKIKLSIADRVYPLTIDPAQEEGLRKAAKNIEQLAKKFEQNYAVRDKQDVLAMCALQFASKIEQTDIEQTEGTKEAEERLKALDELVNSKLAMK